VDLVLGVLGPSKLIRKGHHARRATLSMMQQQYLRHFERISLLYSAEFERAFQYSRVPAPFTFRARAQQQQRPNPD
jgi:hypothetical protein